MSIAARLTELGIVLPQPAAAVANYVPFVRAGNLLHISGQLSNDASGGIKGVVGEDVSPEQAQAGARLCGINLLAQMNAALDGDLERVVRVVKLGGFVQAGPKHPPVHGVVSHVNHKTGHLTVRVHHRASGNRAAHTTHHKFTVHATTVVQKAHQGQHTLMTYQQVHHGQHVVVHRGDAHPHVATRIDVHHK